MRARDYILIIAIVYNIVATSNCDKNVDSSEKVVLITPVLAPHRGQRAKVTETAKDFPLLTLFATNDDPDPLEGEPIAEDVQPIYVKKLEDGVSLDTSVETKHT